jgi:biotin operon repressor
MVRGRDIEHDDKRVLKWNDRTSSHELESDPAQAYMSDERMAILKIIGSAHMRVQDIAHEAGKSRQAVHKLLQKLCGLGALAQDERGKYYAPQQMSYPVGYDAPAEPPKPPPIWNTLLSNQQRALHDAYRKNERDRFTKICQGYSFTSLADTLWEELCQLDTQ